MTPVLTLTYFDASLFISRNATRTLCWRHCTVENALDVDINSIPVLPVFADARNKITNSFVTCMPYQKKWNISINKILIYNRKWFRHLVHVKPVQATMCVLCLQWLHLFSAVERIWQGEIKKFTKSLNVSSKRLKKQYFIENSLKTSKTHMLSM